MSQTVGSDVPSEIEWQQLWFSLRSREWHTIALVGIDIADLATEAAQRLAKVGMRDEKTPVEVISALGMSFQGTTALARECQSVAPPALRLIACDSPAEHPAALPLLQAVAGVVLVVNLGARLESVRRVAELAGRDKVLATVSVG